MQNNNPHNYIQEGEIHLRELINLLIEKSNGDRNSLRNEIEKIKSFSLNKKQIGIDEVKSIINFSGEYKSYDLINECHVAIFYNIKKFYRNCM